MKPLVRYTAVITSSARISSVKIVILDAESVMMLRHAEPVIRDTITQMTLFVLRARLSAWNVLVIVVRLVNLIGLLIPTGNVPRTV